MLCEQGVYISLESPTVNENQLDQAFTMTFQWGMGERSMTLQCYACFSLPGPSLTLDSWSNSAFVQALFHFLSEIGVSAATDQGTSHSEAPPLGKSGNDINLLESGECCLEFCQFGLFF